MAKEKEPTDILREIVESIIKYKWITPYNPKVKEAKEYLRKHDLKKGE